MTPKEKAEELFNKFCKSMPLTYINNEIVLGISEEAAKRCALIAVDELIKSCPSIKEESWHELLYEKYSEYWQEVKQEIEKL